jgi:dolichol-phosphate mannosyltransferase
VLREAWSQALCFLPANKQQAHFDRLYSGGLSKRQTVSQGFGQEIVTPITSVGNPSKDVFSRGLACGLATAYTAGVTEMVDATNRFTLVLPTFNEAGSITAALERAVAALSSEDLAWDILVVDDDSSDGTFDLVTGYNHSEARVRVIGRHGQRGLAGAITFGWAHTEAELVGVMDADLQHPPELLPMLLKEIRNGADIAIASRYLKPGSMDEWNPVRRLLSRLGVLASKPVQPTKLHVHDPLSGFFVVRRECIAGIGFQETGFKLLLEILAKGRIRSVAEVPFKFAIRTSGRSKANAMTAFHYLFLLCKLAVNRLLPGAQGPG